MSNWGIRRRVTALSARNMGGKKSFFSGAAAPNSRTHAPAEPGHANRVAFTSVAVAVAASTLLALGVGSVTAAESVPRGPGISATSVSMSNDASITYAGAWRQISAPGMDGTAVVVDLDGSALLRFAGTQVSWVGRTSPSSGKTDVLLDDVKVAVIDEYSATETFGVVLYTSPVLTDGAHKLKLRTSGLKNAASSGTSLTVDFFKVRTTATLTPIATTPPAVTQTAPVTVAIAEIGDAGISIAWTQNAIAPAWYAISRSTDGSPFETVATVASTVTSYEDISVVPGKASTYQVTALNASKVELARSVTVSAEARQIASLTGYRYDTCPAATVTVSTAAELKSAVYRAAAGTVIRLNPGTYVGSFTVAGSGTPTAPIWICGPRSAVVTAGTGNGFNITDKADVNIAGITIRGSMRAVQVVNSQRVVITDLMIESIGQEAIHLRNQTSDSEVLFNTIHDTGTATPAYGEGIYLGTSDSNWCTYNGCQPDRTTRIRVIGNTIYATGAQAIDVKAGTSDGVIAGNTITGTTVTGGTDWIKVKGNGWIVADNVGTNSPTYGFSTNGSVAGWGKNNIFTRNSATNTGSFGVWIHLPNKVDLGNRVSCLTFGAGNVNGATNVGCVR